MNGNGLKFRRAVARHRIVGLDPAPLIYFIEDVAPNGDLIAPVFTLLENRRLKGVTSTITLAEILTKPFAEAKFDLVDEIKFTLKSFSTLSMVVVDERLAEATALVRARYAIRLPDALQIAAAIQGEATLFITNDKTPEKSRCPRSARLVRFSSKLRT